MSAIAHSMAEKSLFVVEAYFTFKITLLKIIRNQCLINFWNFFCNNCSRDLRTAWHNTPSEYLRLWCLDPCTVPTTASNSIYFTFGFIKRTWSSSPRLSDNFSRLYSGLGEPRSGLPTRRLCWGPNLTVKSKSSYKSWIHFDTDKNPIQESPADR